MFGEEFYFRFYSTAYTWYDRVIFNEKFMTELTQEEVRHVAFLARIGVKDEDVVRYQKDLSSVLAYFEELNTVDTDNVEPIGHITGMTNIFRDDQAVDASEDTKDDIMKNVPEVQDGYIKVKSLF